jgi:hypothetical protein
MCFRGGATERGADWQSMKWNRVWRLLFPPVSIPVRLQISRFRTRETAMAMFFVSAN